MFYQPTIQSMRFQEHYEFDYNSATLLRVLTDADYYRRKYAALGGRSEIGECRNEADVFSIDIRHALDTSQARMPDVVRGRIGHQVMLAQTDTWTRSRAAGHTTMNVEKAPASATLSMQLRDTDTGCRMTLDFDIQVSIPLLGSRVEKAIATPMIGHMKKDLAVTNDIAVDYA